MILVVPEIAPVVSPPEQAHADNSPMKHRHVISTDSSAVAPRRVGIAPPRSVLQRRAAVPAPALFQSFWMAGYEGADHINGAGRPLSMCDLTQHRVQAGSDYARLVDLDMRTVRESAGWRLIDRGGKYDFTPLRGRAHAARAQGLQIIWTLFQYGWPTDVDVFSAAFVERFARYARAAATYLGEFAVGTPVYAPISEISFLAWVAGARGDARMHNASIAGRSAELKCQLVRAAVAACEAILEVEPHARFVSTDPLMHVVAPRGRPDLAAAIRRQRELQFEAWDMLSGRTCPHLGGRPRYLDIVGVNYYANNQWEFQTQRPLAWQFDDPRRVPLSQLLAKVRQRYNRPLIIAETSHAGVRRASWLREIAAEVAIARRHGTAVEGVCLYPVLDRPDWNNTAHWHDCGLWHLERAADGVLQRRLNPQYAAALREVQRETRAASAAAALRESSRVRVYASM
jgi:hypothetical protein